MLLIIIIFIISIVVAFTMLLFRVWEIRTGRAKVPYNPENPVPDLSFRHVEKSMLYLTKHIVQNAVLVIMKQWFIFVTKTRKMLSDKWPKVYAYFQKKPESSETAKKPSFFRKAVIESGAKIKRIKEKVKKEHEESVENIEVNGENK